MPRYVAFLRGVMPTNARMADLKKCFEKAGFEEVKTVLGSGNVVFSTPRAAVSTLQRRAEAAMQRQLPRAFQTMVRPVRVLEELLQQDAFARLGLGAQDRRVVTFLRRPFKGQLALPIERDGARILAVLGAEVLSAYGPTARGPVFMTLIEKTFGKDVTTRTWETIRKCAAA